MELDVPDWEEEGVPLRDDDGVPVPEKEGVPVRLAVDVPVAAEEADRVGVGVPLREAATLAVDVLLKVGPAVAEGVGDAHTCGRGQWQYQSRK